MWQFFHVWTSKSGPAVNQAHCVAPALFSHRPLYTWHSPYFLLFVFYIYAVLVPLILSPHLSCYITVCGVPAVRRIGWYLRIKILPPRKIPTLYTMFVHIVHKVCHLVVMYNRTGRVRMRTIDVLVRLMSDNDNRTVNKLAKRLRITCG